MRFHDWSSDVCSSDLHPHGVTEHGENALWPGDPSATPTTADFLGYWQRRMQKALSAADAFVASSNSARQILADALPGIAPRATDFHVIPHGRDFERFVQCADAGQAGAGESFRLMGHAIF